MLILYFVIFIRVSFLNEKNIFHFLFKIKCQRGENKNEELPDNKKYFSQFFLFNNK